ncbi:MAG: hypothetical protein J7K22_02510 [Nanoarchaeota archaeon]|nr:hypothetical protein [Nanoarchaeota archaeon]
MAKESYISASSLKRLTKEIEELGGQSLMLKKIENDIKELTKKVEESIKTNLELQEKVAEVMIYLMTIAEAVKNIQPREKVEKPKASLSDLKMLAQENKELTETLKSLENLLKKGATREAIKKALEKARVIK